MNELAYAQYILKQIQIRQKFEYWRAYEVALVHGTRDDPNSFDVNGLPSTDPDHLELGYYPFVIDSDPLTIVYFPCWDRIQAYAGSVIIDPGPDGGWKVEGKPMAEYLPTWEPGEFVSVVLPIMRLPVGSFNLSQMITATLPFDGSREVFLQAVWLNDSSIEIFFTSEDPLT